MCEATARFSDEEQSSDEWDGVEEEVSGLLKIIGVTPCTSLSCFLIPKLAAI